MSENNVSVVKIQRGKLHINNDQKDGQFKYVWEKDNKYYASFDGENWQYTTKCYIPNMVELNLTKKNLFYALVDFFGLNDVDGTYIYELTRVKEAFDVGTMTLDDFEEFTEERVEELANFLWDKFSIEKGE